MSTKRLSHLKDGDKIYLEVTRKINEYYDDDTSLFFESKEDDVCVSDEDTLYTLEELKQLANDGMPKQGEMIEARYKTEGGVLFDWFLVKYICMYEGGVLIDTGMRILKYDEWRPLPKKTELTLAEVEEKLGLDAGSLIIK